VTSPDPGTLYREPNALAGHYRAFDVSRRLLLTGHSHQAWPDLARAAMARAFDDAALHSDRKWALAEQKARRVREGFAGLLADRPERIALGQNTHELLVRWLSALPLRGKPRLLTTDGEFHSARRQLARLEEEGIEVVRVPSARADEIAPLLELALDARTAAVIVSAVLYADARIVPGLGELARSCARVEVPLVIDAYHALDALPFELPAQGLESAFVLGGGYKYCQLGEGCAFLRMPADCALRPVITGWFAELEEIEHIPASGRVAYPDGPGRFAGATYDPVSHYRAAAVFDFFAQQGLTPAFLREISQHQVGLLAREFDRLDLDPVRVDRNRELPLHAQGGFLALRSPRAGELVRALAERGVQVDSRGELVRFGPAPYLCDRQLRDAMQALRDAVHCMR